MSDPPNVPRSPAPFGGSRARSATLVGLGVAVVVLLVAVLVLASGDDGDQDVASSDSATTTSTVDGESGAIGPGAPPGSVPGAQDPAPGDEAAGTGAPSEPSSGDGAATATTAPATTVPSTTQPRTDLGTPEHPGPASPPLAGIYRYRTTTGDGETTESDVEVVDISRSGGEVVQVVRGQGGGGGFEADNTYVWTSDRVVISESVYHVNGNEAECDWEPDVIQAILPLRVGASWENDSTCTVSDVGPTPVIVTQSGSAEVVALERREIAGEVLDLWVIEGTANVQFSGITIEGTTTTWFSPAHGLVVRIEGEGSGSSPDGSQSGSFTSEVLNLTPR